MREKDTVSFEKMSLAKMERINSRNVRATFEFESVSKPRGILQGWDYHVHTYMEQRSVSPWIPLPILIGNFSRPSTRGRREGEGARRDYIGYGLRVIPCKPREAFFPPFSAPAFIPLEKRSSLLGNHQSVSFLSRDRGNNSRTTIFRDRSSDLITLKPRDCQG